MIQIKLQKLLDSVDSISLLCSKPISALLAFRIAKIAKAADVEIKQFEETRIKKAKELGKLSESGDKYIFDDASQVIFSEDMMKLVSAEISLPGEPVKLSDLEKIEIEPKHFVVLDWLISE